MTLRGLAREFKDYPATAIFCLLWIVVFAAMISTQIADGDHPPLPKWLVLGIGGGHRFGDLSLQDLAHGEFWRLVTSTFVHFSVLHLGLNLLAMYQLGTLVESWYGTPQLIFIYGLTGGGGNLVSALFRHASGSNPRVHSGGGSVVIMGLVGLCAVVGLRSRTRNGAAMGRLMVIFMIVTALIGIALPRFIDNWGHAGGALVGTALGFFHRALSGGYGRPAAWGRGVWMGLVIVACGTAQKIDDRLEAPARQEAHLARRVTELERSYLTLANIARLIRQGGDAKLVVKWLGAVDLMPGRDSSPRTELGRVHSLTEAATARTLSAQESHELDELMTGLLKRAHRAYTAEREKLWKLRSEPFYRRMHRSETDRSWSLRARPAR